jgi:phytoene synthase
VAQEVRDRAPSSAYLAEDLAHCKAILARGSRSFALASALLPKRFRDPIAAFYAFCRVSDDAIDQSPDPRSAYAALRSRVAAIATGQPSSDPVDRALAWAMRARGLPRAPLDALLEGYLWDVEGRTYRTFGEVVEYAVRVASSVGVAIAAMMGARDRSTLARAADLGAAMQLTNIARDVGEDARRRRIYLPLDWLEEEGVDKDRLLAAPRFEPGLGRVVRRLLEQADVLYVRAARGIPALPPDCRVAVRAASAMYADIGRVIRARGYDSISERAVTGRARKALLVMSAYAEEAIGGHSAGPEEEPLPEAVFLVESVLGSAEWRDAGR